MNHTLRKATLVDLNQLTQLFELYRKFYKQEADAVAAQNFLSERISKQESVIFVAENEAGELLGFTQLYPLFSSTKMQRLWLLNDLYVLEEARGKGVSKKLIEEAKQLCRETKASGLMLETAINNTVGNNLYPATGFQLDTDHNYYFWSAN